MVLVGRQIDLNSNAQKYDHKYRYQIREHPLENSTPIFAIDPNQLPKDAIRRDGIRV